MCTVALTEIMVQILFSLLKTTLLPHEIAISTQTLTLIKKDPTHRFVL